MEKSLTYQNRERDKQMCYYVFLSTVVLVVSFLVFSRLGPVDKEYVKGIADIRDLPSSTPISSNLSVQTTGRERKSGLLGEAEAEKYTPAVFDSTEAEINSTVVNLADSLKSNSFLEIYDLIGSSLRTIFDQDSFIASLDSFNRRVLDARIVSDVVLVGDTFAEVELELLLSDGDVETYKVILRLEGSYSAESGKAWKIFGTDKL